MSWRKTLNLETCGKTLGMTAVAAAAARLSPMNPCRESDSALGSQPHRVGLLLLHDRGSLRDGPSLLCLRWLRGLDFLYEYHCYSRLRSMLHVSAPHCGDGLVWLRYHVHLVCRWRSLAMELVSQSFREWLYTEYAVLCLGLKKSMRDDT